MNRGNKFVVVKEAIADFIAILPSVGGSPKTTGTISFQAYNSARIPIGSIAVYVGNDGSGINPELWDVTPPFGKRICEGDTKNYRKLCGVSIRNWRDALLVVGETV